MTANALTGVGTEELEDLARRLRIDSIRMTTEAGSGHPTSAMSAADVAAALFARHFTFDVDRPDRDDNDRFVLSKGHAAPLLYALMGAFGLADRDDAMTLRQEGSRFEGHPVPALPMVDVATGSLGQGLSNGLGMAIAQRLRSLDAHTWVVLGDSEMAEGSVWEAVELAGHMAVGNLVAILDLNRLGQHGVTMHEWDATSFVARAEAVGWVTFEIDGHDFVEIEKALSEAKAHHRPALIVARTVKGKGVGFVEDDVDRHGKPLDSDEAERALEELGEASEERWAFGHVPDGDPPARPRSPGRPAFPEFSDPVATRDGFGAALAGIVEADPTIVVLDAEVGDSTRSSKAEDEAPSRFIETYIAEQNMVGIAAGLQTYGFHPVAATFGAFLTRAHDFIRMAALGRARMTLVGSHAGVSIGEDGPSQMALDDLAMMRALEAQVYYPADGTAAAACLGLALDHDGISYMRTTRGKTPVLYGSDAEFEAGGSHVHRAGSNDDVTLVGAGVTVFEALEAADRLAEDDISARVVDLYSLAPLDDDTLADCASATDLMVVVEDHRRAGGLGEAVAASVASRGIPIPIVSLAVEGVPGSADEAAQRRLAGIDADAIVETVRNVL